MRELSDRPERLGADDGLGEIPRVMPGQVWNDDGLYGSGGPLLVISVDSAYAYCRAGRDGNGEPRRVALAKFHERRRGGLSLVSLSEGLEDLVERRVLTAVWELDYVGRPATTKTICDVLGGYYSARRVEVALCDAEARELALRSVESGGEEWRLTGGRSAHSGRRVAPAVRAPVAPMLDSPARTGGSVRRTQEARVGE